MEEDFPPFKPDMDIRLKLPILADMSHLHEVKNRKPGADGLMKAPLLFINDTVLFPYAMTTLHFEKGSGALDIVAKAFESNTTFFGISPDPLEKDSYLAIGVEIAVGQIVPEDDGSASGLLQGRRRVHIQEILVENDMPYATAVVARDNSRKSREATALTNLVLKAYAQFIEESGELSDDILNLAKNIDNPSQLADFITSTLEIPYKTRLDLLVEIKGTERLRMLLPILMEKLQLLSLEAEIQSQVQGEMDQSHREAYLQEQLNQIQKQLGESKSVDPDIRNLEDLLETKPLGREARETAQKELGRLKTTPSLSPESGMIQTYVRWILDLPWIEKTTDNLSILHAEEILNKNHYGLKKAKDRILEYLAVHSLKPKRSRQPILCFVGAPGTGKTSLGQSIAEAMERKFVRVSLGGVHDEAEIRGHRRTYIGALPGRILQTMKKAGVINPVFMLDEVDKLSSDFQGDPAAALLEVLDPEQNFAFQDHYLDIPYDLSSTLFITTANSAAAIPPALLDRMELIEFPGYIQEDKLEISRQFLIPEQLLQNGLDEEPIFFTDAALIRVIEAYTYEAGVRNLEREIGAILRKIARLKSEGKPIPTRVDEEDIQGYLGPQEFFQQNAELVDDIGLATAMAWTESSGEIMPIEVLAIPGKSNLQITGQIGEIMQESAQAALSYLKSRAELFQIPEGFFEEYDVHIHVPEGAIPKDGPSAGITLATAITSAVLGVPVRHDVAMTGEITLRGRVLPVGGVREKVLAAYRAGITKVLLPRKNEKDLEELPTRIFDTLKIVFVEHMDEVLAESLSNPPVFAKPHKAPKSKSRKTAQTGTDESPKVI